MLERVETKIVGCRLKVDVYCTRELPGDVGFQGETRRNRVHLNGTNRHLIPK